MILRRYFALCVIALTITLYSVPVKAENLVAYIDVDSIGDVWVFAIDKTASMLTEYDRAWHKRYISPAQVSNSVMSRLSRKGGILDCIDYDNDIAFFYETGYGEDPEESTGYGFRNAAPLEYSFIHDAIEPIYLYGGKGYIEKVLYGLLNCKREEYKYQESFVSQIRVLVLHRAIDWLKENEYSDVFNRIHVVVITDDAEQNDQWRTDYYNIKHRSKEKIQQLNALHEKYIYSTFTQRGGGLLEENEEYSDDSDSRHIYLYDYTTLQQRPENVILQDDLFEVSPMDGEQIIMRLTSKVYRGDTIIFAYIDSICVNGETFYVNCYMQRDSLHVKTQYHNRFNKNDISVYGKIQIEYIDSIYGWHMRKIGFEMHESVITTQMASRRQWAIIIVIAIALMVLLSVLVILPNRHILTLYTSDGEKVRVRRGYKRQWHKGINSLLYSSVDKKSMMVHTVLAKHPCFKATTYGPQIEKYTPWIFISNRPLQCSSQLEKLDTSMDVGLYLERHDECPLILKQLYNNWLLCRIDALSKNRMKWVRSLGRRLHRAYHSLCPHYVYWVAAENMASSLIVTSSILPSSSFLLEIRAENKLQMDNNDQILSSYFQTPDCPRAEVLITTKNNGDITEWNVYHLEANLRLGHGIGDVQHLIHYIHSVTDNAELNKMAKQLRKAIKNEMNISSICVYNVGNIEPSDNAVSFHVEEKACMYYLYLVDDTEKRKAQMIYSPLSDNLSSNMPRKMVVIKHSLFDKELYSSLLPFNDAKSMPAYGACRSESAVKFPAGGALQGELSIDKKTISFLNVTITIH